MNDYQWIAEHKNRVVADHEKAATLLGLSPDELSQHVKRGNVPCVEPNPGRGRSRTYTFQHILHAAIILELAKYGMRFTKQNRDAVDEIVRWVFAKHGGRVAPELIGKTVYFTISFKDGEMRPIRPQWEDRIIVKNLGASGVVVVLTTILAVLLDALKADAEGSND
jgi:hypothetical protein